MNKSFIGVVLSVILTLFTHYLTNAESAEKLQKIIGFVQVRNEENSIEQCLRALYPYTDSIIVLDDCSTDKTVQIVQSLVGELNIECIIVNTVSAWEKTRESNNLQILLNAGRECGGTHFMVVDVDEMISAQCARGNWLRQKILMLKTGQALFLQMPHLWRSFDRYRDDSSRWSPKNCWCGFIFCDDGVCNYAENIKDSHSGFIHLGRLPKNRRPVETDIFIDNLNYAILHFRFVNWQNIMIKRAR